MKLPKILLVATMALAFIILIQACSSAKSRRGCDGNKKTKVPFGYM